MVDYDKLQAPHVFRWLDHIQHLPGMLESVHELGLFVTFPDEANAKPLSKAQQKKLAKLESQQQKKKDKKEGGAPATAGGQKEEGKEEEKKETAPKKEKQQK